MARSRWRFAEVRRVNMKKFKNTEKGKPGETLGILNTVPVPIKIEEEIDDDNGN